MRHLVFFAILLSCAHSIFAAEAKVPITVSHEFIRAALVKQLFRFKDESFRPMDDGSGCYFLELKHPVVDSKDGYLHVIADIKARVGKAIGKRCVYVFQWYGKIELFEELVIPPHGQRIRAKVRKSNLLDKDGKEASIKNRVWQWLDKYVHPRMEAVVFDLTKPARTLQEIVGLSFPGVNRRELYDIMKSLRMASVNPVEQGVDFVFSLQIPQSSANPRPPEPPLTEQEIAAFLPYINELDSFYTAILQHAAGEQNQQIKEELLEVLLDLRHDIVDIVSQQQPVRGKPVRDLFLKTWVRLAPVFKRMSVSGSDYQYTLRYLSFIAAGDALQALDKVGPSLGLDISTDGLRRLARTFSPGISQPLKYSEEVDSNLRRSFGFGPPLRPSTNPKTNFLDWFFTPVYAAADLPPEKVKQLNEIIPHYKNLPVYLPLAEEVLRYAAQRTLAKKKLNQKYHDVYRWLVISAAWKESCWRQYVKHKGKRAPLQSGAGAVGMMQIVPKVWRGFYDTKYLKWDYVYNVQAGSEILMRYMKRYAIRKGEHKHEGGLDNLARASYAAYNAGPGKLSRYRNPKATRRQKIVDRSYYEKYKLVKEGKITDVKTCWVGG